MAALKMSSALKHLLNFNAHPPSLQTTAFNQKLSHLLSDFNRTTSSNQLTSDSWTIFSAAALVSLNRPSAFEPFWTSLLTSNEIEKKTDPIYQANLIRETALKSISFIGIAKSINALNTFRGVLEKHNPEIISKLDQETPRRIPNTQENSRENISKRAMLTWKSIYRPLDEKLIDKLSSAHPDLPIHILNSHYGPLLSDPESSPGPIGRMGVSLIAIGTLRAASHLGPQLLSHVYGLKKAGEELAGVGERSLGQGEGIQWLTSDEGAQWVLSSIDRLVHLISTSEITPPTTSKL